MSDTKTLTLAIRTVRNIPAFAGYVAGTAKSGTARIIVNMDGLLWASVEGEPGEFRRSFIDSLAHEFIHALEDSFGLLFDEEAVEASIAKVRAGMSSNGQETRLSSEQSGFDSPHSYPLQHNAKDDKGHCQPWCYACERQGLVERVKFTADYESIKYQLSQVGQ